MTAMGRKWTLGLVSRLPLSPRGNGFLALRSQVYSGGATIAFFCCVIAALTQQAALKLSGYVGLCRPTAELAFENCE